MKELSIHNQMARSDIANGLSHLLDQKVNDETIFGALKEPLYVSQVQILAATKKAVEDGIDEGTIVAPGGSGKTRLGIALGAAVAHHGRKTLFVVDKQESLQKFASDARELMPKMRVGEVYQESKTLGDLTFITINSLRSRVNAFRTGKQVKDGAPIDPATFDMVLWDEAHMHLTPLAQDLKQEFSHCVNIGITATPRYYEGKQVQDHFGPDIANISYETARRRGEVNRYSNHLVNTGIYTGLTNLSAEQEESAVVAKTNNRRDRNLIAADLYLNGKVKQDGKKVPLAGMTATVLVSSINHAHDQAAAINDALMPHLKHDEVFRQHLRDKGIDPDKVRQVAVAVHSGGTEIHDALNLDERKRRVTANNNRETLITVATNVLQQSHDNPKTQLMIDTVPRMTYVGVGQSGYRATRTCPGKGPSVILNYEDADRPTLTFDDFTDARQHNREQGTVMPVMSATDNTNKPSALPEQAKERSVAPYKVISGDKMSKLLVERKAERAREFNRLARTDEDYGLSSRHFTAAGLKNIRQLMERIGEGDLTARDPFLKTIQPFIDRTTKRIASQVFGQHVDEEIVKDIAQDVIIKLMTDPESFQKSTRSWSIFSQAFQNQLRNGFKEELEQEERRQGVKTKLAADTDSAHESDPSQHYEAKERALRVAKVIETLTPQESKVLTLRYGFDGVDDATLQEVGNQFDRTGEAIRKVESRAIQKLKHESMADLIRPYVDPDNSQAQEYTNRLQKEQLFTQADLARNEICKLCNVERPKDKTGLVYDRAGLTPLQWDAVMNADFTPLRNDTYSNNQYSASAPFAGQIKLLRLEETKIYKALAARISGQHTDPYEVNNSLKKLRQALYVIVAAATAAQETGQADKPVRADHIPSHRSSYFADPKPHRNRLFTTPDNTASGPVPLIYTAPRDIYDEQYIFDMQVADRKRQTHLRLQKIQEEEEGKTLLGSIEPYRETIRNIISAGYATPLDKAAFMRVTKLNAQEYDALMVADLHTNPSARDFLRDKNNYDQIAEKLQNTGFDITNKDSNGIAYEDFAIGRAVTEQLERALRRIAGLAVSSTMTMKDGFNLDHYKPIQKELTWAEASKPYVAAKNESWTTKIRPDVLSRARLKQLFKTPQGEQRDEYEIMRFVGLTDSEYYMLMEADLSNDKRAREKLLSSVRDITFRIKKAFQPPLNKFVTMDAYDRDKVMSHANLIDYNIGELTKYAQEIETGAISCKTSHLI